MFSSAPVCSHRCSACSAPSVTRTPDLPALIDTGADATILPFVIADALGVTWASLRDAPAVTGFGGADAAKYWDVEVRATLWPSFLISDRVVVVRRNVPLVLGRTEFLGRVVLEMHWYRDPPFYRIDLA